MEGEIIFNIDVMLAKRKMSVTELADRVGITLANMSILKTPLRSPGLSAGRSARIPETGHLILNKTAKPVNL